MTLGTSIPGLCQFLFRAAGWGRGPEGPPPASDTCTGRQQAPPGPLRCDTGVQPPVDTTSPCCNVGAMRTERAPVSRAGCKAQRAPPRRPRQSRGAARWTPLTSIFRSRSARIRPQAN